MPGARFWKKNVFQWKTENHQNHRINRGNHRSDEFGLQDRFKHKSSSNSSKSSHRKSSQNHRMFFSEKKRNMSNSIKTKATARLTKSEHRQRTTNTQGERSPSDFETPSALAQQLPMMYRDCSPWCAPHVRTTVLLKENILFSDSNSQEQSGSRWIVVNRMTAHVACSAHDRAKGAQ